jgi:hypothetical protein
MSLFAVHRLEQRGNLKADTEYVAKVLEHERSQGIQADKSLSDSSRSALNRLPMLLLNASTMLLAKSQEYMQVEHRVEAKAAVTGKILNTRLHLMKTIASSILLTVPSANPNCLLVAVAGVILKRQSQIARIHRSIMHALDIEKRALKLAEGSLDPQRIALVLNVHMGNLVRQRKTIGESESVRSCARLEQEPPHAGISEA